MGKRQDDQPKTLRAALNAATIDRLHTAWFGMRVFRAIFFALAAAVAGAAQFITWGPNESPTPAQVVGIAATIVVLLAALVSIVTEKDSARELELAQRAVARVEEVQERLEDSIRLAPNVDSMIALYQVVSLFRDHLESSCVAMVGDVGALLGGMLTLVRRPLTTAADFAGFSQEWTICIYQARPTSHDCRFELHLVEHLRSIPCEKTIARVWPEGKGVAGIAYANASEIVIEDLTDETVRTVFKPAGLERKYDDDRYLSMVAVPILVQGNDRPWGIVAATSNRAGHFNHDAEPGFKPIEAIRAVAKYAALGVAMLESRDRASNPAPRLS